MSVAAPVKDEVTVTEHDGQEHPSDRKYIQIAIILGVLTAAEVATYPAEDILGSALIPILIVLMVIKFWYVAAFFMHLKFDTRMFSGVFVAGLVFAVGVYLGALAMLHFFA